MQVSVKETVGLGRSISVVVDEKDVQKRLNKAYNKLNNDVSMKGFRKGKVPRKILEQTYGEQVHNEVADELVQETYFDALEETKLEAVVHPDVREFKYEDDGSFSYTAEIDVKPDFELDEYKGLEIEMPAIVISDADIDAKLAEMRREHAMLGTVEDRPSAMDDVVSIDFTAEKDGQLMDNVKGTGYSVDIGSGRNGIEFEEQIVGLSVGEEATRTIEFPVDFGNQLLAGNVIAFNIKVNDIKGRTFADLDDDFAQEISADFKTLDDLKADIKKNFEVEREKARRGDLVDVIMLKLLDNHDFDIPQRLVAHEVSQHIKQLEDSLDKQEMTLETAGLSREKLIEDYKGDATKRVKGDFILKKIAEVEGIKVEDTDVTAGFQRIADQYSMTVDDVKKYFGRREDLLPFMHEILNEKIVEFLSKESSIKYVEAADSKA
ncbi:MAG: trigger factor [Desulfobulbaceae bacterium]|jgi:trigger factor|nr:trigger factor [Desulfobulbaceae bacterium]